MTKSHQFEYWEHFYASDNIEELRSPSEFAKLAAINFVQNAQIFDVGCGNGRDSFFFQEKGFQVTSIDFSPTAIESVLKRNSLLGFSGKGQILDFENKKDIQENIYKLKNSRTEFNLVIYARFFLHALTENAENNFFEWVSEVTAKDDSLFLEYRSPHPDVNYTTPPHYRKPVTEKDVRSKLESLSFDIVTSESSEGFAPFRSEKSYVSRTIGKKK